MIPAIYRFYIRYILHPWFMLQARFMPRFADYAYIWVMNLQRKAQKTIMTPDYIQQLRDTLSEKQDGSND